MMKLVLALLLCMFSSAAFAVDTLEVYAFLVQFKKEQPDNSLTTGDGTFGSDLKNKEVYSLDPVKMRNSVSYWQKHFEFANSYFQAASGGKLVVKAEIFPRASSGQTVYELKKPIIDYNRTKKMKGEKTAAYGFARARDYLSFIYDAVMAAHGSKDSPFKDPLPKSPNTKRAYMIIHAGASRLVDGGSMGTDGADTPGDFMDFYISPEYWGYLSPDSNYVSVKKIKSEKSRKKDSTVVTGLVLKDAAIDTLRSIMVVSETASQDGLNWGINGILVNQLARELGMPDTYDVEKGISRLGYFDLMDFAGYSSGNGFMPSLPNAWHRAYMGWSKVKEVRPVAGKSVTVDVAAAGSGLGTEIVKVPLSANEYLLIENRQRSLEKNGDIYIELGDASADDESWKDSIKVDSIGNVFLDSICKKDKCKKNTKKASGIILSMSSYDAGLPASGIAVWKVNEWYLRERLQYGYANAWNGDTLRDHQFGISLVEADGILSVGKTFKNALGRDAYDYGAGTDLLPHKRYGSKSGEKFEMVKSIKPTGYANTKTTQGGYTGIKITVNEPKNARKEKTANAFMGDSVINYVAPIISVTISIDDGSIDNSKFPRNVGLAGAIRGAVFVDDPENDGEKLLVVGAMDGTLQVFNALGDTLFAADTVVKLPRVSKKDTVMKVPLYRVGASFGALVGMASDGKDVYSLHRKKFVKTSFGSGIPMQEDYDIETATAGPVIVGDEIRFATKQGVYVFKKTDGKIKLEEEREGIEDLVYCGTSNKKDLFAYVTNQGIAYVQDREIKLNGKSKETFRLACTDLDRDGVVDIVAVGSRGTVTASSTVESKKGLSWTKTYKRGAAGTTGLKDETSGIALGDINEDGYPEIVFLGDNLVYALDYSGLPVGGFPVKITRGSPIFGFFSDPLIVDVNKDDSPEILVPSSDGLVYAYTGKGKAVGDQFPIAAGSYEYLDSTMIIQPMSIFVADAIPGKKSAGPELYALHRNSLSAFRLRKASADAASSAAAWTLPAGGNERTGYFDADRLGDVKKKDAKKEISEFFVYPNPVKGGKAKARFEIGAPAKTATFELYDITGLCVYKKKMSDLNAGRNQFENLDLKSLGSDVYTARLKVDFEGGNTKQKVFRVGIVH